MAIANETLVGRYGKLLIQLFGMKGGNPSPQMAPELQPTVQVTGSDDGSLFYLRDERLYSINAGASAGGAGLFSAVALQNPPGSGSIIDVTLIAVLAITTADLVLVRVVNNFGFVGWAPGVQAVVRDSRILGNSAAQTQQVNNLAAAALTFGDQMWGAIAGVVDRLNSHFILAPGGSLIVANLVANAGLDVSFQFTEHTATPNELK